MLNEALKRITSNSEPRLTLLRGQQVGPAGAAAIAAAMASNETITALDLYGTAIDDRSVDLLSQALLEHGCCTSLDLGGNSVSGASMSALAYLTRLPPGDSALKAHESTPPLSRF